MSDRESGGELVRTLAGSLWFPLFFFFGFMLCYLLPFHAPTPHDVKVAVSGPAVAGELQAAFDQQAPGAYDVIPVKNASAAREAVLDRDAVAGFALHGNHATLYTAKAAGASLERVVNTTFSQVAAQGDEKLSTVELVPTASGDTLGTGLFYLAMAWSFIGYLAVMMMLRAVTLSRRVKLLAVMGLGAFASIVGYFIGVGMDVIPNEPLALLYAFLITQAVAWVTYGLVPFARQALPGVAVGLFVMLSVPSSGGAIPWQMTPAFFRWLHPVMPMGNLLDALRGIFYFDNKGLLHPTVVLCVWAVVGAALIGVGALLQRRQEQQAALEGADDASADDGDQVEEAVVEDPAFETPLPHPVQMHMGKHARREAPMLIGKVSEDNGAGVVGAVVTIMDARGRQLVRTVTDREGVYAATGLPEGIVTIVLSAPGRTPDVARVLPRSGRTLHRDFTLPEHHRTALRPTAAD
ncbi:carboxypeptidase regulatory-like domain-containing protein [Streptomyces sp. NPDC046805]|uniref:carboxypeptidase regulatory-like domain-containing protein n=1 Tax=Streptomyces sp. NPDC046805 TaxID=3155134 RepID=UPI0033F95B16